MHTPRLLAVAVTGPDKKWATDDDLVGNAIRFKLANGRVVERSVSDDHLSQYSVESGDRCMRAQCGVVYPW